MVPLATPASSAISAIVAADIPFRAMTRIAASWMEWTRYSETTSSFDLDRTVSPLNERSVNQNPESAVKRPRTQDAVASVQQRIRDGVRRRPPLDCRLGILIH